MSQAAAPQWPKLRADLKMELVAEPGAMPSLIVTEPIQGRYFRFAWPESAIFLCWKDSKSPESLAQITTAQYGFAPEKELMDDLFKFIYSHQLTELDEKGGWNRYTEGLAKAKKSVIMKVINGYMFTRVPLMRPDKMLKALLPYVGWAFSPYFWGALAVLASFGIYLASRQADALWLAAKSALQFQNLGVYAFALLVAKLIHEMGHALAAAKHNTRVHSMGLAVMFGAPLFYCDTSDSWRLPKKMQRLQIVIAGVAAEAIIAVFALLCWVLLRDGLLRDMAFAFATTTLVMTIVVNMNPFMRYDGYFALSDILDVPNLQARSFALGKWRLRKTLLGLDVPAPEQFGIWKERGLTIFSYLTWFNRFFMFLGIAFLLYYTLGKVFGSAMFAFEIITLIMMPIIKEIIEWWKEREKMRWSIRPIITASTLVLALLVLFVPWITTVSVPAVKMAQVEREIHAPDDAQLVSVSVKENQSVKAGQELASLFSPKLENALLRADLDLDYVERQIIISELEPNIRSDLNVLRERKRELEESRKGILETIARLNVVAQEDGIAVDLNETMVPGTWINKREPMLRIISAKGSRYLAFVPEESLAIINEQKPAKFFSDTRPDGVEPVTFSAKSSATDGMLTEIALAKDFGGLIEVTREKDQYKTVGGWYQYSFVNPGVDTRDRTNGLIIINAKARSPFQLLVNRVLTVFGREHVV